MAVAQGTPYPESQHRRVMPRGSVTLVEGPLFRLDRIDGTPDAGLAARYCGQVLVIPLDRAVTVAGEPVSAGECALAPALDAVQFASDGLCLVAQPV